MTITITNTQKIIYINGIPARVWEGKTESGVPIHAFVTRIGVDKSENLEQFEKELQSCKPLSKELESYPTKLLL